MKTVILCDRDGNATGTEELRAAHTGEGKLHRAFSVFIRRGNSYLLQQRSHLKPLFALCWANTCCSHLRVIDSLEQEATERLQQEMGFSCPLQTIGTFVYHALDPIGHGAEHEFDTVLLGEVTDDVTVRPDPEEVHEWRWVALDDLQRELRDTPENFAPWFAPALSLIVSHG